MYRRGARKATSTVAGRARPWASLIIRYMYSTYSLVEVQTTVHNTLPTLLHFYTSTRCTVTSSKFSEPEHPTGRGQAASDSRSAGPHFLEAGGPGPARAGQGRAGQGRAGQGRGCLSMICTLGRPVPARKDIRYLHSPIHTVSM